MVSRALPGPFVGLAVGGAGFEGGAGEEGDEGAAVVVAAGLLLAEGHAAELWWSR
jgi:hypothetical protein